MTLWLEVVAGATTARLERDNRPSARSQTSPKAARINSGVRLGFWLLYRRWYAPPPASQSVRIAGPLSEDSDKVTLHYASQAAGQNA